MVRHQARPEIHQVEAGTVVNLQSLQLLQEMAELAMAGTRARPKLPRRFLVSQPGRSLGDQTSDQFLRTYGPRRQNCFRKVLMSMTR